MMYVKRNRGLGITDAQSATNCAAGGGTYNYSTGDCNAPPGGALYTRQLADMAAADCPWYCLPFLNYPDTSPCSDCAGASISLATPGGVPMWAWALGAGALVLAILPKVMGR